MARRMRWLVAGLIVVGGLLPALLYWGAIGRAPTVTAEGARRLLADPRYALVDVRSAESFAASHAQGAVSWPGAVGEAPAELSGKKLLVICGIGFSSAQAVKALNAAELGRAWSVQGGMQTWDIGAPPPCVPAGGVRLMPTKAVSGPIPPGFRLSTAGEQWAAIITTFAVKPFYMMLSLVLAGVLIRRREADLVALRWALIAFFLGEFFCAVNFVAYRDRSYLFEYLHNLGMVLAFAFGSWAALEAIDRRILKYSHPDARCSAISLCQRCIKHADVPCGLQRLFLLLMPAAAVIAAVPLFAPFRGGAYSTIIFGGPYSYVHEVWHQIYEIRLLPVMAMVLLAAALVATWVERYPVRVGKVLAAAGLGAMGFGFFRLILLSAFFDGQVWFNFWEEITELLSILFVAGILWIFRRGIFTTSPQPTAS